MSNRRMAAAWTLVIRLLPVSRRLSDCCVMPIRAAAWDCDRPVLRRMAANSLFVINAPSLAYVVKHALPDQLQTVLYGLQL